MNLLVFYRTFALVSVSEIYFKTLDPPKIVTKFDTNTRLLEGPNKSVQCSAIGSPPLTVHWESDGIIIEPNKELRYMPNMHDRNVSCVAKNDFGRDSRSVSITWIGEIIILQNNWTMTISIA